MPAAPAVRPLTDWVVLSLLVEEPRHGFAVAREVHADVPLGQVWTVHRPLVYRAIDHLVTDGLAEPAHTEPGAQGPHRTVYRPTGAGRVACADWLARPVAHPREARTELLVKLLLLERRHLDLKPLARAQLDCFRSLTDKLAQACDAATGADRLIALWRYETVTATNHVLETIVLDP